MMVVSRLVLFFVVLLQIVSLNHGFVIRQQQKLTVSKGFNQPPSYQHLSTVRLSAPDEQSQPQPQPQSQSTETDDEKRQKLQEKMAAWEATEQEVKDASLLGITPGKTDGFDIGLWIMFPIMVGTGLIFLFFPFIMDKIDVSSVGPPPTS